MPLEVVGGGTDTTGTSPAPEIVAGEESSTTLELSSVLPVGPVHFVPSRTLFSSDDEDNQEEEGGAPQPPALACGVLADHATPSVSSLP